MPIEFTLAEIAKTEDSLIESDVTELVFRSGARIVRKDVSGKAKWILALPGYPEVSYDSLGDAYAKATAVTFAIKS